MFGKVKFIYIFLRAHELIKILFCLLFITTAGISNTKQERSIKFFGLERTTNDRALSLVNHLQIEDNWSLERATSNLRNSGLFSKVEPNYNSESDVYSFTVQERWTTIPILKFSSGGGVSKSTFGLYDINWFGEYVEFGGQVEVLEGQNSLVLWNRTPQFLGSENKVLFELWNTSHIERVYENGLTKDPSFYIKEERTAILGGSFPINKNVLIETRFSFAQLKSSENLIDKPERFSDFESLPKDTDIYRLSMSLKLGEIDYLETREKGKLLETQLIYDSYNFQKSSFNDKQVSSIYSKYKQAILVGDSTNLAYLLSHVAKSEQGEIFSDKLGGLDFIRGYPHAAILSSGYKAAKIESRFTIETGTFLTLQPIIFIDWLSADRTYYSYGFGNRFIIPKIFRMTARLDYAIPGNKDLNPSIAFGLQQFF